MALLYEDPHVSASDGGSCSLCGRVRTFSLSCDSRTLQLRGATYRAIPYGREIWNQRAPRGRCLGCAVLPGGLHHERCSEAECPNCGGHLATCRCR